MEGDISDYDNDDLDFINTLEDYNNNNSNNNSNNNDYDADGNLMTLRSSGLRELINLSRSINLRLILSSFVANIYQ